MVKVVSTTEGRRRQLNRKAQDLIMNQISIIGYGDNYEQFVDEVGDPEEAERILMKQMDRVAKLFGYDSAWFS